MWNNLIKFRVIKILKVIEILKSLVKVDFGIEYSPYERSSCASIEYRAKDWHRAKDWTYLEQIGKGKLRYDMCISCWPTITSTALNIATGRKRFYPYRLLSFGNRTPGKLLTFAETNRNGKLLAAAGKGCVLVLSVFPPPLAMSDKIEEHFSRTVT